MRIYASGRPLYQITHQIHDLMVQCDHEFFSPLS
ncbi:hypothetical protein HMPREF1279_01564 [Propionibacterium sp. KPL1852]|nr:hypothetical protein HMPREF1301_01870 [Propionibacterium sp. KPL2005]ERS26011.1 hypothetical protein HMPREF1297_01582 [Propionibacterium sp. KPL2000]ERS37289.1 hypothetical protein HMPREF1271_01830 [Propionibacterium sp. KPL1838]ERS66219.1 hypothetical protein HMPREF1279_01564 [Propionibacterium sp. KPL1852]